MEVYFLWGMLALVSISVWLPLLAGIIRGAVNMYLWAMGRDYRYAPVPRKMSRPGPSYNIGGNF